MKKTYHFIGVGGAGMSGLAEYFVSSGNTVSGSDANRSATTDVLVSKGVEVFIGHSKNNLPRDIDVCVFSSAVGEDNVELAECRRRGIKTLSRAEALGAVTAEFKNFIAVSGCHGKTTTSALIFSLLKSCGFKPSLFLGGEYEGSNYSGGDGDCCIAEACEYRRSFLALKPTVAVILNVDRDHVDCYDSLSDTESAFADFAALTDTDGATILYAPLKNTLKKRGFCGKTITFSDASDDADYRAVNVGDEKGVFFYDLYEAGKYVCHVKLPSEGYYLVPCSLAAIAVCVFLGRDAIDAVAGLKDFSGVQRRWQKFESNFTNVIADYAHHPTEIKSLVFSAKKLGFKRVFLLFQPHTYSRTAGLLDEFATCFKGADAVVVLPIYAARETPVKGGDSSDLAKAVSKHTPCVEVKDFKAAKEYFSDLTKDDLLLVVGAGNVVDFCTDEYLNN